jgi:hypothetical protein
VKSVSVSQITVTESKKLGLKEILQHRAFLLQSDVFLPFVENESLLYFLDEKNDQLIKLPFDRTNPSIISLSNSPKEPFSSLYDSTHPIYYNGSIFYCDVSSDTTRI